MKVVLVLTPTEKLFPWWLLLIYVLVCLTSALENRCRRCYK